MDILELLKILMALFSVGFGLFALLRPDAIAEASQLTLHNPRGRAETRIAFGGFFVGMGLGAILFGSVLGDADAAYQVVGLAWLGGAAARILSGLALDEIGGDRVYWGLLLTEVIPAAVLLIPNS